MSSFEHHFRLAVEKVFNYWPDLKLAVQHGMGGRNGQQTAIEIMNYTYAYCIGNEKITQGELQDVIEELMDQEFNTLCYDDSIPEICRNLLRYLEMCRNGKFSEIEAEFLRLPAGQEWLKDDIKVTPVHLDDSSEEESDCSSSSEMEVDDVGPSSSEIAESRTNSAFVEPEPGWTTVRSKKKNQN